MSNKNKIHLYTYLFMIILISVCGITGILMYSTLNDIVVAFQSGSLNNSVIIISIIKIISFSVICLVFFCIFAFCGISSLLGPKYKLFRKASDY